MATILDNLKQLSLTILCNYLRLSETILSQTFLVNYLGQSQSTFSHFKRLSENFIPDFLRQLFKTSYQSIFLTYIVTKYQTTIEQHNNIINYKTIGFGPHRNQPSHRFLSQYQIGLVLDSLQTGSPGLGIQKKIQEDNASRQRQDPLILDLLFILHILPTRRDSTSMWITRNQGSKHWVC